MVKRNAHLAKLNSGYLFPEINKRKKALLARQPDAKIISLGIGDTSEPLATCVTDKLQYHAEGLSLRERYSGYGQEQGHPDLRQKIGETLYSGKAAANEIFVSDGSKCDIGRLQILFGAQATIAVQDPTYPVYVDTGVILGQSNHYDPHHAQYQGIHYMRCLPENDFFPDLSKVSPTDLIYFCSPNNPTGTVATKEQLAQLVAFAKKNRSIIIFDAAYAAYVSDPELPRSIYEIEGAREVAIELGSFSKMAGFTGLRLGWSVVPEELRFDDGSSVHKDWDRINSTFFNGASNVVQGGGIAVLEKEGMRAVREMVSVYMGNAVIIRKALEEMGFATYGGHQAPYIWAKFGEKKSWDLFEEILEKAHVVTTPGSGFGPAGEGFLRFSAFNQRSQVEEAIQRLRTYFGGESRS
jgi:LL-diaminopimelate aminotransferase